MTHPDRPSDEVLRRFLLGTLPAEETAQVEAWMTVDPLAAAVLGALQPRDSLADVLACLPTPPIDARHLERAARVSTGEAALPELPGYDLLGEIGRGGMGVVYKARQRKLNRIVALKQIGDGAEFDPERKVRLLQEAELVARLQHPHVVQIHEVLQHQGQLYLSLEYVDGPTLAAWGDNKPKAPKQAAHIVQTLALAMQHAHERGVVHRDLKPSNVLLAPASGRDSARPPEAGANIPKISDFGLGKKLEETGHTVTGEVMGTPSYMAPEQARGESKRVGPAADVWGLGAILYELLTGRPPFLAATTFDTLFAVIHDDPVSPRQLQPTVPRDLETIGLKCLQKDPARRYATAQELADDLGRFLANEPVLAREIGKGERAWRWAKRHPALTAVYVLLLLVVGLGGVGGTMAWLWWSAEAARLVATHAKNDLEKSNRDLADARDLLAQSSYLYRTDLALREWKNNKIPSAIRFLDLCPEPRRHWEWHYAHRLCHSELATIGGETREPDSLALSPEGKVLARQGPEGLVLWDWQEQREVLSLPGTNGVRFFCFSHDGRFIAAGMMALMEDGKAEPPEETTVWDRATGRECVRLKWDRPGMAIAGAFSPDGRLFAALNTNRKSVGLDQEAPGLLRVWETLSGQVIYTLPILDKQVRCLCFAPDSKTLATGSSLGLVHIREARTGTIKHTLNSPSQGVGSLCYTPSGQMLAGGGFADGIIRFWDANTGLGMAPLKGHTGPVDSLSFSSDGKYLASGEGNGVVKVWGVYGREEVATFKGHTGSITMVGFLPDGRRLVSSSEDGKTKFWNTQVDPEVTILKGNLGYGEAHGGGTREFCFHPDGKRLATLSDGNTVRIWDVAEGKILKTFKAHKEAGSIIRFSPDGRLLATGRMGLDPSRPPSGVDNLPPWLPGEIKLWDAESGQLVREVSESIGSVFDLCFSPDSQFLAAALDGPAVRVWRVVTGQRHLDLEIPGTQGLINALTYSPDGRRLLASRGGTIQFWDAVTGTPGQVLDVSGGAEATGIDALCYSPDGRLLAVALEDDIRVGGCRVELRNARTLDLRHTLLLNYSARCLSFTPDGERLAVNSTSAASGPDWVDSLQIWDTRSGQEALTLKNGNSISWLSFSPDGKQLACVGSGQIVRLWDSGRIGPP